MKFPRRRSPSCTPAPQPTGGPLPERRPQPTTAENHNNTKGEGIQREHGKAHYHSTIRCPRLLAPGKPRPHHQERPQHRTDPAHRPPPPTRPGTPVRTHRRPLPHQRHHRHLHPLRHPHQRNRRPGRTLVRRRILLPYDGAPRTSLALPVSSTQTGAVQQGRHLRADMYDSKTFPSSDGCHALVANLQSPARPRKYRHLPHRAVEPERA